MYLNIIKKLNNNVFIQQNNLNNAKIQNNVPQNNNAANQNIFSKDINNTNNPFNSQSNKPNF
jgi:hypothetical protein